MTRPSRRSSADGVRTSLTSAPSDSSARRWASKSPWMARTPMRSGGRLKSTAAALEQAAGGGEGFDLEAGHRIAELHRRLGDALGVVEVRGGLDDRASPAGGILALEDPGADEVALGAELHHQRGIGRGGDPARAEERDRQPAALGDVLSHVERRPVLLRGAGELLRAQ